MAKTKKPTHKPSTPFPTAAETLHQEDNWLWIPLRKEWRDVTTKPEEIVHQHFIRALVDHYGYNLDQMDQERRTQHGHKSPRADIVIWQSAADKAATRTPVLVVECKTETIEIQERDYYQGESYTRATGCEFFVATNARHTAVFKLVPGLPGGFVAINEIPKATDWGDAKRLKEIREFLRTFNRKEFQDLLFVCHSILRDVHKMDPGRAFDTISSNNWNASTFPRLATTSRVWPLNASLAPPSGASWGNSSRRVRLSISWSICSTRKNST